MELVGFNLDLDLYKLGTFDLDVSGSFYDKNQKIWNVNNLGTILDDLESDYGTKIEGLIPHIYISGCGKQHLLGIQKIWIYIQLIIYILVHLNNGKKK